MLMNAKGLTQAQLADIADVDSATVNRVLNGSVRLVSDSLNKLAKALGVTPAHLLAENLEVQTNVSAAPIGTRRVPVLDYVQAGAFSGIAPHFRDEEMQDFLLTDGQYSESAFALKIRGESMAPRFREGDTVIIDPAVKPLPNEFVVATNGNGEATFKQYKDRGESNGSHIFELVPLNDGYPAMRSDQTPVKVIGTMVEHRQYRRR